ncbi:hypothetical protein BOW53_06945 [Solemya pervernicosa gill symbiont]|uniref:Alkaline phytoceramidase n=1 Tax=Solemya pervernicosa gill symbiont TaxID=642797 RepID=A0A1T2L6F0_9GAMM|nr:hypothetical protein BOW53_06945 [Solemya pervernicosa gill symbiont]
MLKGSREKLGAVLIAVAGLLGVIVLFAQGAIPQDTAYHDFKDQRTIMGVPNFWNVLSNLPFLIVGAIGFYKVTISDRLKIIINFRIAYGLLFAGTALVSLGSGYYHLWPNNETLVWDRLPMTFAFMALFSIVISEYIFVDLGRRLFVPLVIVGVASVAYWHVTELRGEGDLRFYALVQFFPMLAIPIILLTFRSMFTTASGYWWLFVAYLAAKLLEHFDGEVYSLLGFISGHSLKHVAAALGVYVLMVSYQRRIGAE